MFQPPIPFSTNFGNPFGRSMNPDPSQAPVRSSLANKLRNCYVGCSVYIGPKLHRGSFLFCGPRFHEGFCADVLWPHVGGLVYSTNSRCRGVGGSGCVCTCCLVVRLFTCPSTRTSIFRNINPFADSFCPCVAWDVQLVDERASLHYRGNADTSFILLVPTPLMGQHA